MPVYYVSSIRKDSMGIITHLFVHSGDASHRILPGNMIPLNEAIKLVDIPGNTLMTVRWNYVSAQFRVGAKINKVRLGNQLYLVTDEESAAQDSLDNMLPSNSINPGYE